MNTYFVYFEDGIHIEVKAEDWFWYDDSYWFWDRGDRESEPDLRQKQSECFVAVFLADKTVGIVKNETNSQ